MKVICNNINHKDCYKECPHRESHEFKTDKDDCCDTKTCTVAGYCTTIGLMVICQETTGDEV